MFFLALLSAGIFFILGCMQVEDLLNKCKLTESFVIKGQGVSYERADQALKDNAALNEGYSLVFWTQDNDVSVENALMPAEQEMDVISTKGNSGLLYPLMNFELMEDKVCLISLGAAREIRAFPGEFGAQIKAMGKERQALALVDSTESFLVVQASEDLQMSFKRITIRNPLNASTVISENSLSSKLGLEVTQLDFKALALVGFLALSTVPLLLMIFFFLYARFLFNYAESRSMKILVSVLVSVSILTVTVATTSLLSAFSEYVPTQWSSFREWGILFTDFTESLKLLFSTSLYMPDYAHFTSFLSVLVFSFLSSLSLLFSYHFLRVSQLTRKKALHEKVES